MDPEEIQLLCLADDVAISLKDIKWEVPPTNTNPVTLNSIQASELVLSCKVGTGTLLVVNVVVQGK